jgi:hypothetical protein
MPPCEGESWLADPELSGSNAALIGEDIFGTPTARRTDERKRQRGRGFDALRPVVQFVELADSEAKLGEREAARPRTRWLGVAERAHDEALFDQLD